MILPSRAIARTALGLALLLAMPGGAADLEVGMRKDEAVPRVFVAGVPAEPGPELDAWLVAHEDVEVRLPFTVWRGPTGEIENAAMGVVASPPGTRLRLYDAALGIPLSTRLRAACGDAPRCVVVLSGKPAVPTAGPTFSVRAFHGLLADGAPPMTATARAPDCLAIRSMRPGHCARGPDRCKECRKASEAPARPRLLDVCPDDADVVARPVVDVVRAGRTEHRVYDVIREFADDAEAKAFAQEYGIADVMLVPQ